METFVCMVVWLKLANWAPLVFVDFQFCFVSLFLSALRPIVVVVVVALVICVAFKLRNSRKLTFIQQPAGNDGRSTLLFEHGLHSRRTVTSISTSGSGHIQPPLEHLAPRAAHLHLHAVCVLHAACFAAGGGRRLSWMPLG